MTSRFTIGTKRVEIALDRAALPQPAHPNGYVSFTGEITDGSSGQIVNSLRAMTDNPDVHLVCKAWDLFHLKDDTPALDGTVERLKSLDGQHIDPPDTDGEREDCSFDNADDVIDSRDVIARIEYLRAFVEDHLTATDARDELAILEALEDEASGYAADWRYGEPLIRDSYFEHYARELAEDIGAINKSASWPNNCIDWDQAARELQQDYTSVNFDNVIYWIR